jgi:hypothetical protein
LFGEIPLDLNNYSSTICHKTYWTAGEKNEVTLDAKVKPIRKLPPTRRDLIFIQEERVKLAVIGRNVEESILLFIEEI